MAEGKRLIKHKSVNLRKTHPALYRSIMTLALMSTCMAVNFWRSNPTFKPYGIPKNIIGYIFFGLGVSKLMFLNLIRDLRLIRISLSASFAFYVFWGIANTPQFFAGKASLQLPILYVGISAFHMFMLIEAPVNPTTEKQQ